MEDAYRTIWNRSTQNNQKMIHITSMLESFVLHTPPPKKQNKEGGPQKEQETRNLSIDFKADLRGVRHRF